MSLCQTPKNPFSIGLDSNDHFPAFQFVTILVTHTLHINLWGQYTPHQSAIFLYHNTN